MAVHRLHTENLRQAPVIVELSALQMCIDSSVYSA